MRFEEGGSRIDDLKLILGRVAFATSLFDHDGISVRVSRDHNDDARMSKMLTWNLAHLSL